MPLRNRKTIVLDGRRRALLGDVAAYDIYLAEVAEDGVITLTPAEIIPAVRRPKPAPRAGQRNVRKTAPAAAAVEKPQDQE